MAEKSKPKVTRERSVDRKILAAASLSNLSDELYKFTLTSASGESREYIITAKVAAAIVEGFRKRLPAEAK